ncbi:phage integrase SAM-like domain-containing protein [Elizabethkingia ursingii]|uniref:Integrase n=1 Tax=Elizabethkingia ursingii TaxID=1756150 RepID=A0ABX3NB43_9FLAO|nr:phage integrase SAM-like domain-containing protein [Elizabethkingia ursingii]OPB87128.1 integrase [Elizabethkingia ursingii]
MMLTFSLPEAKDFKNIHFEITPNNSPSFKFRIPLKINPDQWDKEKQRPKNIYLKKHKKLNQKLDQIKISLLAYIRQRNEQKKGLSHKSLYKLILSICSQKETGDISDTSYYPEGSLLFYMASYIQSKKEFICHSTYKRYKVFFNLLQRFEGFIGKHLFIEDIDSGFLQTFFSFGRKEEYSENTIYRSIHFIKTILNFVERKGIRTAVRELDVRREKQQKEIVSLSEKEIITIEQTKVPEELQAAKDWLLISCYTGQRYSDFMRFTTDQLTGIEHQIKDHNNQKSCIEFIQQKTKKNILLPLHPVVLEIIEKNGNSFPKTLDIITYNEQIKKVTKLAGLHQEIKARKRIGHRVRILLIEKWAVISSHIGRRSFASNFYGKIPTPLLMEATGHSTEQMFLKYIDPVNSERIISLSRHFNEIHKESSRYLQQAG